MKAAKVDLRVRSKVEGQSRIRVEWSTSCPGHILEESSPPSNPVWPLLHASLGPRARNMLMNPEPHRSGTPLLPVPLAGKTASPRIVNELSQS